MGSKPGLPELAKQEETALMKQSALFSKLSQNALLIALVLQSMAVVLYMSGLVRIGTLPVVSYLTSFDGLAGHPSCSSAVEISTSEFHQRQVALARALHELNGSAFIAEPGASARFFFNVSTSNWKLSERPLLLVISPGNVNGETIPKIFVLTPKFETMRAGLLPIPVPSKFNVTFIQWPEEANPYEIAVKSLNLSPGTVYVDGSSRYFIVDGLQAALTGQEVMPSPIEIANIRSQKSAAELQIMKCVNELTLEAIRSTHKKMYIGMRESEARLMMASALTAAGLENGGCLTLFGEDAALPHGSSSDRTLRKSDFALFDCTASLHGYWSDVTRTVAIQRSRISSEHLRVWHLVRSAQNIALSQAKKGLLTGDVDKMVRSFLTAVGHGGHFTHRLGHGIGLEVHERPYLVAGSSDIIQIGHTFSDEPGVYIEGELGVRLEDCFYIDEQGEAVLLTHGVGGQANTPWMP